jgi:hypothetical protein
LIAPVSGLHSPRHVLQLGRDQPQVLCTTMTIVIYAHRYKRPPRKRKAVELEVPAIVTRERPKAAAQGRTDTLATAEEVPDATTLPANADRKSAIVTVRRHKHAHVLEGMTPEEHRKRGDAADALFQEIARRASEKVRP